MFMRKLFLHVSFIYLFVIEFIDDEKSWDKAQPYDTQVVLVFVTINSF